MAFYLPQFHPIPENDRWWGPGFTEWANVTGGRPLFPGHRQPRLPGRLGFYDLRLPDTRAQQASLAAAAGVEGFCYWHYWFHGRRLIERPFREVLESGEPDFPFCLAWANEPWTRTWLGQGEVLMDQTYSAEDDLAHARWLVQAWADPRWLRVGQRPVFVIYAPSALPEPRRTVEILRAEAVRAGLPDPFLIGTNAKDRNLDATALGFDATLDFRPQLSDLPFAFDSKLRAGRVRRNWRLGIRDPRLRVYGAAEAVALMDRRRGRLAHQVIPCVFAGWDNSPRRGRQGTIVVGYTPEVFASEVQKAVDLVVDRPAEGRFVFVNAWNEWAEGNVLEPDALEQTARLDALRSVMVGA